jgi:hypothetical protein
VGLPVRGAHLFPLFAGGDIDWTSDESVARAPLDSRPPRFHVLGVAGNVRGHFTIAENGVPADPRGYVGTFRFGWSPCTELSPGRSTVTHVDCALAGNCGISLAVDGDPSPGSPVPAPTITQICIKGGSLVGDLDRDGALESFPLEGFRGPGPIDGERATGTPCREPLFSWYGTSVGGDVIDVLGAIDLDLDGHLELLIAHRRAGGPRTVALYTPAPTPTLRLERRAAVTR